MLTRLVYARPEHRRLPHFLNMSGGRSSAAMALDMAEDGALSKDRGDAVVFCNTSAEHPMTYVFAREVSEELETYDIPVFWLEYCTVEDQRKNGKFFRRRWYRLVNRQRYHPEKNPFGYRQDGSVFEEMISFRQFLPSLFRRGCTEMMKILTSIQYSAEWMSKSEYTLGGGHGGERQLDSHMRATEYFKRGDRTRTHEDVQRMFVKSYDDSVVTVAPQRWQDFTSVDLSHRTGPAATVPIFRRKDGQPLVSYVRILGLRADEPARVDRVIDRMIYDQGCSNGRNPPGENILVPLYELGTGKKEIMDFWSNKPYDLRAPQWATNCTFCFMKGPKVVAIGAANETEQKTIGSDSTPLEWWMDMEQKYARYGVKKGNYGSQFGWLGQGKPSYRRLLEEGGTAPSLELDLTESLPCDCTD